MSELIVVAFDEPNKADEVLNELRALQREYLIELVRKMLPEKVLNDLSRFRGRVLRTSLSPEQEARLQEALSGMGATPPPGNTGTTANAPGAAQAAAAAHGVTS